ncbi:hypothetical protein A1O1_03694 [Capronia coronata CBS 617.96]|uniref:RNA helicase n=1 Tax=Capronia coronata CBS 617.96 TaxID=1182541 RepID=W9YMX6_9EURO|nr:uncharacterized protein A1O1_03694 [Capronia coronata CBS 617.96]EXJ90591.1 hypothetical protein A1O1_03694 [Capronia coronata CBS 617.96]
MRARSFTQCGRLNSPISCESSRVARHLRLRGQVQTSPCTRPLHSKCAIFYNASRDGNIHSRKEIDSSPSGLNAPKANLAYSHNVPAAGDGSNSHLGDEDSKQEAGSTASETQAPDEDGSTSATSPTKRRKPFDVTVPAVNLLTAIDTIKLARQHGLTDEEVVPTPYAKESARGWMGDILRNNRILAAKMKSNLEDSRRKGRMPDILAARHKLPLMSGTIRPKLLELINNCDVTIILSKTGSGKTTQIPQIILDKRVMDGLGPSTSILCTQPRRIAATSTARRVAYERGETLQDSVGYHIRNDKWSARQQASITYCTTGILLNRLVADEAGTLQSHSHIIIDEVHERNVQIDLVLAILRRAAQTRKAAGQKFPKIILMSATIDPSMFLEYFRQPANTGISLLAESFEVEGSPHHIETHYLPEILSDLTKDKASHHTMYTLLQGKNTDISSANYIRNEMHFATKYSRSLQPHSSDQTVQLTENDAADSAAQAVDRGYIGLATAVIAHLAQRKPEGDILVFLPGKADIDEIFNHLIELRPLGVDFNDKAKFKLFKLHSQLRDSNDEVFKPVAPGCRRIILATNIAETSVTLPEVVYVVDSGLLRSNAFDPFTRMRSLPYDWISKTSLIQRRGRAGRVRNGHYYALFTKQRHDSLIAMRRPEIAVADLVNVVLQLKAHPQRVDVKEFLRETIEPPPAQAIESAIKDLQSLHALTETQEITSLGRLLSRFALHPAAAKGILLGALFGCLEPMLILACHNSTDSLISHPELTSRQLSEMKQQYATENESDLVAVIEAFREYHAAHRAGNMDLVKELRERRPIRHHVYVDMMLASTAIHDILTDVGFLPAAEPGRSVFEILPSTMNANRDNKVLVKALGVNTITPELAAWREKRPLKKSWSLDDANATGIISRDSVNEKPTKRKYVFSRKYRSDGRLLAYSWKHDIPDSNPKAVWLDQTSMVTPLMVVLFSRRVSLRSPRMVKINDWPRLRLIAEEETPPVLAEQTARILMELRKTVDRFVGSAWEELGMLDLSGDRRPSSSRSAKEIDRSRRRDRPLLSDELRKVMVDSVVKILEEDDAFWKAFRDRKRVENLEAEAKYVEEMNRMKSNDPVDDGIEERSNTLESHGGAVSLVNELDEDADDEPEPRTTAAAV